MSKLKFALLISLVIAIAAPFVFETSFVYIADILLLQIFIALPLAVVALFLYLSQRSRGDQHFRSAKTALAIALVLLVQIVSIPIIVKLENRKIAAAETYLESLIPQIEAYKAANNAYPEAIAGITSQLKMPDFLRQQEPYHLTRDGYEFSFNRQGSIYRFDNHAGTWLLTPD
jgi:c-di-AMP phosphodiesterase-like protein